MSGGESCKLGKVYWRHTDALDCAVNNKDYGIKRVDCFIGNFWCDYKIVPKSEGDPAETASASSSYVPPAHENHFCFPGDEYVFEKTEVGQQRAITFAELANRFAMGERPLIAARNDSTGALEYQPVMGVLLHPAGELQDIAYSTSSGTTAHLRVTDNHPLANCGSTGFAYPAASAFSTGALLCGAGQQAQINSISAGGTSNGPVYDITMGDGGSHNYFVSPTGNLGNAVLAHNKPYY